MPISRALRTRLKIAVVSLLASIIPAACTTCYTPAPTASPTPMCYTPTPRPFVSPISPISPLPTPTPTPQARHELLERLRAERRLPEGVARQLEG